MANYKRKYNWTEIAEYYNAGNTYVDTKSKFGFAARSWEKAVIRGDIKPRHNTVNPANILDGTYKTKNRSHLRTQLIKHNIIPYKCAECGNNGIWNDKPLALDLDHINGINNDDRIENLRFLCPNCHRQTDSYAGKNVGKGTYNRQNKKYKTRGYDPSK